MNDFNRYDRQIRLWGEKGQLSIENASVCVIGSSALATEILKGLVLAGIGRFCVIDNALITEPDLARNFFITIKDIGKSRAEIELNPSVKGNYIEHDVKTLLPELKSKFHQFSVVIATNLIGQIALNYSYYFYENNIYFITARTYGMIGYLRLCFRQHVIYNTHSEHSPHDFQLDTLFDKLDEMIKSEDLETMNYERHSHTPYLILYFKALKIWQSKRQKEENINNKTIILPHNYEERKEFEKILMSLRKVNDKGSYLEDNFEEAKKNIIKSFNFEKIPKNVQNVFNDVKTDNLKNRFDTTTLPKNYEILSPFWVFAAAVKKFTTLNDGRLPLSGNLPDMISDSERYVNLQKIYREKAEKEAKQVYELAKEIFEERYNFLNPFPLIRRFNSNRSLTERMDIDDEDVKQNIQKETQYISWNQCLEFCKNITKIATQNGKSLDSEYMTEMKPFIQKISHPFQQEQNFESKKGLIVDPIVWFFVLKAIDHYYLVENDFPGNITSNAPYVSKLKIFLTELVKKTNDNDLINKINNYFPHQIFKEAYRANNAEIHVIAAILGGVVAQEAIKLITCQYLPLDNTLIYDGYSQNAVSFQI